jgi:hypothetical protein
LANTTGANNSFFGIDAGKLSTTGGSNAFFGASAGNTNTTGSSNTIIGNNADVGSSNLTYATAIGAGSVVTASNTIMLGRSSDLVVAPGFIKVNLGAAGFIPVCHNEFTKQLSSCAAGVHSANSTSLNDSVEKQNTLIEQQQRQIDELKSIVCSLKPDAAVCKETIK